MKQSTRRLIAAVLLAVSLVLSGSLHEQQQHEQLVRLAIVDPGSGGGTGGN